LVGHFKKAKGGFTQIFVAVDKFRKWVEAKPTASITMAKLVEFVKEIMYRLASQATLSPIMGLSLLRGSSRTFVQTQALKSTTPQCHTRRAMVR
jgi:hypothetical protein